MTCLEVILPFGGPSKKKDLVINKTPAQAFTRATHYLQSYSELAEVRGG